MLYRKTHNGLLGITQPTHCWVSGQFARAWGSHEFGHFLPAEELVLAAALHDIGFLDWENAPSLDPASGLPYSFMDLPTGLHFDLWRRGIRHVLQLNRYAALMVSLHYTGLAERHPVSGPPEEIALQTAFLTEQAKFQTDLIRQLQLHPEYAKACNPDNLARNQRLMAVWDWMSLVIGMGADQTPVIIDDVPANAGRATLRLHFDQPVPSSIRIDPWPFRKPGLQLRIQARHFMTPIPHSQKASGQLDHVLIDLLPG